MTDGTPSPSAPRRGGPWPLLAITLLVLLLSAFLAIRWHRRDSGPAVVKEPPHPAPVAVPTTPSVPPTTEPQKDPREETYAAAVKGAEEAIAAKHWSDAESAINKARDLFDRPRLKELEDKIRAGRDSESAAAKADLEMKLKQDAAWSEARRKVEEELRPKSLYDVAVAALEKVEQEFPKILQDQRYLDLKKKMQELRDDADKQFQEEMARAEKALAAERYSEALEASRQAARFFPSRLGLVKTFQERVNEVLQAKLMVRIVCNTTCTVGGDASDDERPIRKIKLPTFLIDKYKVTNEDYFAFVTATDRPVPAHWVKRKPPPGKEKHPVTFVNYADAEVYAAWAGKRLPTAEEWEVAARGPDAREFPWGNAFTEKENVFHCNCVERWQLTKEPPSTMAVDAFDGANSVSFYNVYGMGGNVWEWTSTKKTRLVNGKPEEFRVLKGGSFMTGARAIRCANVLPEDPTLALPDVGFRCVKDVK